MTNTTLGEVWAWYLRSMHKITGRIGLEKWPNYSQLFINTSENQIWKSIKLG